MAGRIARITWAITFVLILGFATGCTEEKQSQKPNGNYRIVTDCIGRKVRIPAHVHRVVDLALLDGTRTMVELGVSDKLVGVNDFVKNFMCGKDGEDFSCWFAAPKAAPQIKNLLSVGSCREPNVELLRSLAPDIILAYASYAELAIAVEKQTGVPVVCIRSSGCLDFEMLRLVGEIVGKQERAEELIAYAQSKIRSIAERVAQIPEDKRVKVFFWGWPVQDAPRTIAPYDPIDMAGGINVAMQAEIKPYESYNITKEQLAVWNPDIILLQWWTKKKCRCQGRDYSFRSLPSNGLSGKKQTSVLLAEFYERMGPCNGGM